VARQSWLSGLLFALTAGMGVVALGLPFVRPQVGAGVEGQAGWLTAVLLLLCLLVLWVELQGQAVNAKVVATLGVLVALTAVLRFIETAIPGPGGFSPIFAPIILGGYIFGARFGFLLGSLTLLVSALITGGIGPWLPYQMFTAGWVGLTAGWLPHQPNQPATQRTLWLLMLFGFVWGLAYGAIINLYSWPFIVGQPSSSWAEGLSWQEGVQRYAAFYLLTSLVWDVARGVGTAVLLYILGLPTLRVLTRFQQKINFENE
jgi:energy-coupling factor transport system substrate-specific component